MRAHAFLVVLVALSITSPGSYAQLTRYTIATVAGSDPVRDGRPAERALLQNVGGIVFDGAGRLLIADSAGNRIRIVTPDRSASDPFTAYVFGTIATLAGVGAAGFSGDGGPASEAHIAGPHNLALDTAGNIYFTELAGGRVRWVGPSGVIRTVAGGGTSRGNTDGMAATAVSLLAPSGIAVDPKNNLYISEGIIGGQIRRVSPDGVITTIAGGGDLGLQADGGSARQARLLAPGALALDRDGNLYVCEQARACVRKVAPDGKITTFAGTGVPGYSGDGGQASKAQLVAPTGLAVDGSGNLFILDAGTGSWNIRVVSPDGVIRTSLNAYPGFPNGIALDPRGNLWMAGSFNNSRIGIVQRGVPLWVIGDAFSTPDGLAALESLVYNPWGVTVDQSGLVYLTERLGGRIRVIDRRGVMLTLDVDPSLVSSGGFSPSAIVADRDGNLWIGDQAQRRVLRINRADGVIRTVAGNGQTGSSGDGGPALDAQLGSLDWMAVDSDGALFLTSAINNTVRKVGIDGRITTVAGNGQRGFSGDGGPAVSAQLAPSSIAVDQEGNLYIADALNRRIRSISPAGIITTVAGGGTQTGDGPATDVDIPSPGGVAVTAAGELFFTTGTALYQVSRSGWLERIAGSDLPGYSGDNGPALEARLNAPGVLWVDETGSIFFADTGNQRIRKLTPATR
jgi:sugar lactone lactonase YvrE